MSKDIKDLWDGAEPSDPVMTLLYVTRGGVVGNATIAARMAELILEPLIGAAKLTARLPLAVEERGARWSINSSRKTEGSGGFDPCHLEIRKVDAAVSELSKPAARDVLADAATAEKFAAIVLESAYGEAELQRQLPLRVEDQGECWLVRGSYNTDRAIEGPGPFRLKAQKRDARVLEAHGLWITHMPPDVQAEVQAILRERARKQRDET